MSTTTDGRIISQSIVDGVTTTLIRKTDGSLLLCKTGSEEANDIVIRLGLIDTEIDGGDGNDTIISQNAADDIDGGNGDDTIHAGGGKDHVKGGSGNDTVFGQGGHDVLLGGMDNDELTGNSGKDIIHGGDGDDVLHGKRGKDILMGDDGQDVLIGNMNDDLLYGGSGFDVLSGNLGADTFVMSSQKLLGADAVADVDLVAFFRSGTDMLYAERGETVHVARFDEDGDGTADHTIVTQNGGHGLILAGYLGDISSDDFFHGNVVEFV